MAKEHPYAHAKRRYRERYNAELTRSNYQQMIGMVQREQGIFVKKDETRATTWIIAFKGRQIKVIFDHAKQAITTFLPFGSAQGNPLDKPNATD